MKNASMETSVQDNQRTSAMKMSPEASRENSLEILDPNDPLFVALEDPAYRQKMFNLLNKMPLNEGGKGQEPAPASPNSL